MTDPLVPLDMEEGFDMPDSEIIMEAKRLAREDGVVNVYSWIPIWLLYFDQAARSLGVARGPCVGGKS